MRLLEALRSRQLLTPVQLEELNDLDDSQLALEVVARAWLTVQQLEELGQELTLGPYRILAFLGAGGMSRVFRAQHRRLKRIVALKLIRADKLNPQAQERFLQEAETAASLTHSNIVLVHDADQAGNCHFLALELVEGPNLEDWVREKGPLPVREACDYIRQAALGLRHAHDNGVIHRDIKPSNLMVSFSKDLHDADGAIVKILDFGLATVAESTTVDDAQVQGTPDYMSPEQAQNLNSVDARSDLYSLGCTFYFLLSGRAPFADGTTALEKLVMHRSETPQPLSAFREDLPLALEAIVAQLIAKNREDRFANCNEFIKRLDGFLQSEQKSGDSSMCLSAVPWRDGVDPEEVLRPRAPSVSADNLKSAPPAPKAAGPSSAETACLKPETKPEIPASGMRLQGHDGLVSSVAFTADGNTLVSGGVDGTIRVWQREEETFHEMTVTEGGFGEVSLLAFSPDGSTLATVGDRLPGATLWDTRGIVLARTGVLPIPAGTVSNLAFSKDGQLLALSLEKHIYVFSLAEDRPQLIHTLKGHGAFISSLAFTYRGKGLVSGDQQGEVRTWDLHNSGLFGIKSRLLVSIPGQVQAITPSGDGRFLAYGCANQVIYLWDLHHVSSHPHELLGHDSDIRALAFTAQNEMVSVCGLGRVLLWSAETRAKLDELRLPKKMFYRAAFSARGQRLALTHSDGRISVFDCIDDKSDIPVHDVQTDPTKSNDQ